MPIDPNLVNAIGQIRTSPFQLLSGVEGIQGQRNQNQLAQNALRDDEALRNALAGGDIEAIKRVSPGAANQLIQGQGLQDENTRQRQLFASQVLMPMASAVVNSKNPKITAEVLRGSPQLDAFPEIKEALLGEDIEGLSDDEIRQGAADIVRNIQGLAGSPAKVPTSIQEFQFAQDNPEFNEFLAQRKGPLVSINNAQTEAEEAAKTRGKSGGLNLTPGQLAVDKAFADDFVQWQAAGGFADVEKNVQQIGGVLNRLEGDENLTGPGIGITPRAGLAVTNPAALDTLEQVEEVVQRNLRLILGAQFTEQEGKRLIARAYNPSLEESVNSKRLSRLGKSLAAAAKAKQAAADYFSEKGTLAGFSGKVPTLAGIENEIDNSESPQERVERLRREVEGLERGR